MIVYVESNFVLELAFLQEEYERCLELLRLAESQDIHLVLPAFSIGEPYEVWVRRSKQRRALRDQLSTAIRELSRSRPYQASSHEFQELTNLLLRSGEEEIGGTAPCTRVMRVCIFLTSYGAMHFNPWQQVATIQAVIGAFFLTIVGV